MSMRHHKQTDAQGTKMKNKYMSNLSHTHVLFAHRSGLVYVLSRSTGE